MRSEAVFRTSLNKILTILALSWTGLILGLIVLYPPLVLARQALFPGGGGFFPAAFPGNPESPDELADYRFRGIPLQFLYWNPVRLAAGADGHPGEKAAGCLRTAGIHHSALHLGNQLVADIRFRRIPEQSDQRHSSRRGLPLSLLLTGSGSPGSGAAPLSLELLRRQEYPSPAGLGAGNRLDSVRSFPETDLLRHYPAGNPAGPPFLGSFGILPGPGQLQRTGAALPAGTTGTAYNPHIRLSWKPQYPDRSAALVLSGPGIHPSLRPAGLYICPVFPGSFKKAGGAAALAVAPPGTIPRACFLCSPWFCPWGRC
jgi:hypothetical protein